MAEPANSSPGSTDRTDRSDYTSSAVSGYGISPSGTATAAKSSAKSYPTPEDYSKAYYSSRTDYSGTERSRTDYSGTERSRTDYSGTERSRTDYSGTERSRTDYSGTERSRTDYTEQTYSESQEYSADELDAAYSDYSDHYSYSESSGPPSARPAATLMEGVRLFLGAVDEAFTRFAQRDELAPAEPPPRPERRQGPARGSRGGQRRKGGDGSEGVEARRRVLWQETEGLRGALEENLNSIEMILAEIDGQTRQSAAELSQAEAVLLQRERTVARLRAQVDEASAQRERRVAALREELRAVEADLARRSKGATAQAASKTLAAAAAKEAATEAARAKLGSKLRLAEAAVLEHLEEGAPELLAMQRHLALLGRRTARRRAWREPPSQLRPRVEMLSAGLRLSVRVDAVGSGARPELSARWCVLAPAQRGVLLVRSGAGGGGLQWAPPMELDLSRCRRMRLGLPEVQLRGLLAHAPPPGASPRAPPPPPALWAKAHLSFSLLVAPREPRGATATATATATAAGARAGAGAGDGTVGGAVGRGGGGAGAQGEELLELHAVARDRSEMLHCYLGLQGLSGLPPVERLSMGALLWQLLRQLLAARKAKGKGKPLRLAAWLERAAAD